MTDYAGFKHGGTVYPLTASLTNSLLRDADPTLYFALDFFAAMIATHLGTRLLAEAGAVGIAAPITSAVAYKVPHDPAPWLLQEQYKFPLLAVYRKSETLEGRTTTWRQTTTELGVEYILPPLNAAQAERILPILASVGRVLDNRTEQGWDPTYTPPGGAVGDKVWSASFAGLEEIGFTSASYGAYPGLGDLSFSAWIGTLRIRERVSYNAADFVELAAIDHATDLHNDADTAIDDFVEMSSDVTPPGPATAGDD